ncbi:MAG: ATP-dependent sacrificial sulfur transferase LarE [Planctomycetota bacterium]
MHPPPRDVTEAESRLLHALARYEGGAVVALSGGSDSSLVLHAAVDALGRDRLVAATSRSESLPEEDLTESLELCAALGVEHVALSGSEVDIEAFRRNGPDRCFHCKLHLYGEMRDLAARRGLAHVLDGTNADDGEGHRPGLAAGERRGVGSPLAEAGLSKVWVRAVARHRGLASWDKPANACLASRFPYGTAIDRADLLRVQRAERVLRDLGFRDLRVRFHDPVARIEVPLDQVAALLAPGVRERVVEGLRAEGFHWVAVDLEGLRHGSLDEPLRREAAHDGA